MWFIFYILWNYYRSCFVNSVFIRDLFNTLWCLFYNLVSYSSCKSCRACSKSFDVYSTSLSCDIYWKLLILANFGDIPKNCRKGLDKYQISWGLFPPPLELSRCDIVVGLTPSYFQKQCFIYYNILLKLTCSCLIFSCKIIKFLNRNTCSISIWRKIITTYIHHIQPSAII